LDKSTEAFNLSNYFLFQQSWSILCNSCVRVG